MEQFVSRTSLTMSPSHSLQAFPTLHKAHPKVKFFIWIAVLNKINTNDMLEDNLIASNICIMYLHSAEIGAHLFYIMQCSFLAEHVIWVWIELGLSEGFRAVSPYIVQVF